MPPTGLERTIGLRGVVHMSRFLQRWLLQATLLWRPFVGRVRAIAHDSSGAVLLESLVAVVIFSVIGTAVLSGLTTTYSSGDAIERQATAENIARNQIDYALSQPYQDPPFSCSLIGVPTRYGVTCTGEEYVGGNTNVAKLRVTVTFDGAQELALETLRVK